MPFDRKLVEKIVKIAEESDKEIVEKAKELAITARRIGYIRFIDARGKWESRGSSALASKLYKVLKQPVALLIERDDGVKLLIIRSKGRGAYRVATGLVKEGIAPPAHPYPSEQRRIPAQGGAQVEVVARGLANEQDTKLAVCVYFPA